MKKVKIFLSSKCWYDNLFFSDGNFFGLQFSAISLFEGRSMFSMIIQIQPSVQIIWEGIKFLYDLPKQLTYPKKIAFLILYQ